MVRDTQNLDHLQTSLIMKMAANLAVKNNITKDLELQERLTQMKLLSF